MYSEIEKLNLRWRLNNFFSLFEDVKEKQHVIKN